MQPISAEAVIQVIRALYAQLHPAHPEPGEVTVQSRLEDDLGLDSLTREELLQRLETRFDVSAPEPGLSTVRTVGDLVDLLSVSTAKPSADTRAVAAAVPPPARAGPAVLAPPPQHAVTLQQVLAWRAAHDAAATHLILLDGPVPRPLSFGALLEQANRIAYGLQQQGIAPQASIALMLPTSLDFFSAFFGVLLAAAIPVPIYPPAHASQLEEHVLRHTQILANAEAQALITVPEISTVARLLKARVGNLTHLFSVGELAGAGTGPTPFADSSAGSTAMLQYTSGSTGAPKGVILSHANLLANMRAMGRHLGAGSSDVFVSWLPLYHDMGLIGAWLCSLYFGCLLVIMPPTAFLARPARWLRTIHDYRATLSGSPNFGYELAARRITDAELDGLDLSCWRIAFNGAEPVAPETLDRFRDRFGPHGFRREAMTPVYGMAEAAVGLTFPPPGRGPWVDRVDRAKLMHTGRALPAASDDQGTLRFVSCGMPLRGYEVRIVDASGSELPERVEGELQFAGPSATEGYYRNPEATRHLKSGIWRNSGDRAYVANGEIFVTGRSKDLIIRRGRHIYPDELERAVGELEGVRRGCVAAFGSRAADTGTEQLIVVAETRRLDAQQSAALRASITAAVMARIGEPPEEVLLTAPHAVLKTSSGKLRRAATRAAYESGTLGRRRAGPLQQLWALALGSILPAARSGAHSAARRAYGVYAWTTLLAIFVPVIVVTVLGLNAGRAWQLTHRATSLLVRLWRIPLSVQWQEPLQQSIPHILVANHCSYVDSLLLAAVLPMPHRFVARFQQQDLPVVHRYLLRLGTLLIERAGAFDSGTQVRRMQAALAQGESLAVFPEGTFTRAVGLRPFHLGAFQAAVASAVPVIPVALQGTRSMLRDGQTLLRRVPVDIVVGPAIRASTGEDAFAAAVRLRDAARAHVLRHCGEPDAAE